eukprot:TRINITY_DN932_c0_g2_i1.p2 TRINITY_DN932_c0_g2~~TRINITY_DN932_c0_g2_i1.p2  ORF type:complete len:219 (+),score=107.98 TRINITY_DN932_c0_g2_i1:81-737(+)
MIRRPPRSTQSRSSAASDVYKRQVSTQSTWGQKKKSREKLIIMRVATVFILALLVAFACSQQKKGLSRNCQIAVDFLKDLAKRALSNWNNLDALVRIVKVLPQNIERAKRLCAPAKKLALEESVEQEAFENLDFLENDAIDGETIESESLFLQASDGRQECIDRLQDINESINRIVRKDGAQPQDSTRAEFARLVAHFKAAVPVCTKLLFSNQQHQDA